MLDINDELNALRGVGPSLYEKLSNQNIRKIEDLLFFLPIRYEDKTKLIKIGDAIADQKNLTQGKVIDSKILFFGRRALQVILDDGTEKLKLRFFYFSNNQYKQFSYGKTVVCFGLLKKNGKNLEMIHPEYKILKEGETYKTEKTLTPIYQSINDVTKGRFRNLVRQATDVLRNSVPLELIPKQVLKEINLPNLSNSC